MQTMVTVVVRGGTASTNDFEATPSAFQLRIGSGQTSARQSIRLDATGDSTAETDETIIVEGSAPGLTFRSAETTIIDDDQAGIVISRTTITVREQEQGQSYTVKLRSAPDSTVTVIATVEGENEVTATPSRLTFTAVNWNRAQTVTVRAGGDPDGDHEEAKITHKAEGGDYEGRRGETITVTVNDDDEGSRRVALSLSVERIGEGAGAQNPGPHRDTRRRAALNRHRRQRDGRRRNSRGVDGLHRRLRVHDHDPGRRTHRDKHVQLRPGR